jgi:radical SAM/Cys-rich protein
MTMMKFEDKLKSVRSEPLNAKDLKILQVNLGYQCNMACKHCHVSGGPERTEVMDHKTAKQVLNVLLNNDLKTLDITGGAPELNPSFRLLVTEARKSGRLVIVRTNLTIFFEEGMADLYEFYGDQQVELVASLPYYLEEGVDRVRGSGTFRKSIQVLQRLSGLGYGRESTGLLLSLVYNPQGVYLAPDQHILESEYKRELQDQFGISFTRLYTFANMPIGRFKEFLVRNATLGKYMEKLAAAFNPLTLDGIMCRHLINVGWDGRLYDCDFNQVLGIASLSDAPRHISDYEHGTLSKRRIMVDDHCYGCTAGQGST